MRNMAEMDRSIELGAQYLLLIVWRHKLAFLVTALVFATAVAGVTLRTRPSYEATVQLISGQGGLQDIAPGNLKPVEMPDALSIIAGSDEVLRAAVARVGLDVIVGQAAPNESSWRDKLRKSIAFLREQVGAPAEPPGLPRTDALMPLVRHGLSVRIDPKANILSISYRHPDPVIAARVANAIAQAVVDRQTELYGRPGAAAFFEQQRERFEKDFKDASEQLERFSSRTRIYGGTEQQEILLKRRNDMLSALAVTRGQIVDKTGQREALADALRRLAPVARSPYVSALVDALGGDQRSPLTMDPRLQDRTTDPPMLLIRVYQESMAALFKLNAEVAGVQSLEHQQAAELTNVDAELDAFTQNQFRYAELRRAVDQSAYNLGTFAKRTVQEQIDAESNTARFSSVKVLQRAVIPVSPVSPNMKLMGILAVAGGLLCGLAAALLVEWTVAAPRRGSKMPRAAV